jgi:hypothetical protein
MRERRLFPRSGSSCNISVTSDFRILAFNARLENMGEGGIRIVLRERLDIATPLNIEISPPDKRKSILCKGEVIWVNEKITDEGAFSFDTGIKFTDINEEDRVRIRNEQST